MMGTDEHPGVNRRAVKEVLRVCKSREDVEFTLKLSLMEIYNEKIIDLLNPTNLDKDACDIRMDPTTKLPFVSNLTQRQVQSVEEVMATLAEGDSNRSVASTAMNASSSRSHLLLQITVNTHNTISGVSSCGKLTLVDLAGSERVSKSEATGQRLIEAAAINKSLSALGQVFTSLRTNQTHVPYRNSKLTHILQDSLGGDAKTCVFINVSPAESNISETLGTLQFGQVGIISTWFGGFVVIFVYAGHSHYRAGQATCRTSQAADRSSPAAHCSSPTTSSTNQGTRLTSQEKTLRRSFDFQLFAILPLPQTERLHTRQPTFISITLGSLQALRKQC